MPAERDEMAAPDEGDELLDEANPAIQIVE